MNRFHAFVFVFSCFVIGAASCGEPTDAPEDCTTNEFFDEGSELCRTCPALVEPTCPGECEFFVTEEEDRPCPEAVCRIPEGDACVCPSTHPDCDA